MSPFAQQSNGTPHAKWCESVPVIIVLYLYWPIKSFARMSGQSQCIAMTESNFRTQQEYVKVLWEKLNVSIIVVNVLLAKEKRKGFVSASVKF